MPELPEVETVCRGLIKLISGQTIKSIKSDWPKSFPNDEKLVKEKVIGARILDIKRRAKILIIELSSGYSLVVHLKMTGQLVYRGTTNFGAGHPSDSLLGRLPDKSTRVILYFNDSTKLFFNDQRKFGWMKVARTNEVKELFTDRLGPEPLSPNFNRLKLKERLMLRPLSPVKAVIMDQKVIAGIGNIYADESLWGAKIHPLTPVKNLSNEQFKRLHDSLIDVLKLAIKSGGSTDRNYVNAEGRRGSYIGIAKVFRREGQPCPRCAHEIKKIRVVGRGTHYCPYCQRLKVAKISK